MENIIAKLCQDRVFYHFYQISQIPHGSGNEKGISDFLCSWAKGLGLEAEQDELNNVLIRKAPGPGFENAPAAVSLGLAKSRIRYCHDGSLRYPEGGAKNFIRFNSKVDAHGYGKRNICEVELTLTNTAKGLEFSVCGTVWNQQQTDCTLGGQCLDEMLTLARAASWSGAEIALLVEVVDLWRAHHLNGMHAGTPEQEKALENFSGDYSARCEHLRALDLYEVEHEGKPYKYGHGWLYRPIPAADLARIWSLLNA